MREWIKETGYAIEDLFKKIIGEITPDKKLVIILIILLIGTLANLYLTFRAIQAMGSNSRQNDPVQIRHIAPPGIVKHAADTLDADSLKGGYHGME